MSPLSTTSRCLGILALALSATMARAETAADYFVRSLPGAPAEPPIKMHAGHIEVKPEKNGNLFFWHFQNQHIANKQRTVIWLNGGPGCSSEDGALMEIGPYRVKDDHTLVYNEGSWGEFANLLFVDNPVGTGFSFVNTDSFVHELTEMAEQFVTFLEKYFTIFPEYEHDDIYIAGESFAGQHIPYIAQAILDRNKKPTAKTPWNVSGLIIGNGWIAPREQYEAYLSFAYAKGLLKKDSDDAAKLQQQWRICEGKIATGGHKVDYGDCEQVLHDLLDVTSQTKGGNRECYNMYDIRLRDSYPSCGMNWPPDLEFVTPYLRRNEVKDALHIKPGKQSGWMECNGVVSSAMSNHNSKASIELLPDLLKEIPITLFSGAEDLICNHLGTEAFLANMEWNGGKGFEVTPGNWAPRRDWTFEGEAAGIWQEARNLTYVLFYNSSHMVPFDYPRRSRDMLDRVMGVDISSVGGKPADSRIDGEKGPQTSVGNPQKSTQDGDTENALQEAKWQAYRRSGEVVLVIVIVAAGAWGWYVWRDRRKRKEYQALGMNPGGPPPPGSRGLRNSGLDNFRNKRTNRDLETADFDESELDDLHVATPTEGDRRYSIGGASDDEDEKGKKPVRAANGSSSR